MAQLGRCRADDGAIELRRLFGQVFVGDAVAGVALCENRIVPVMLL
jgi:hypothetical protein